MKITVIGSTGQVGSYLTKILSAKHDVIGLSHEELDITDFQKTRDTLFKLKPDLVINTAAYHKTDECEENPEKSFSVNSIAVRNLALTCKDLSAVLLHLSTDYVFDGRKNEPYTEDDVPNPLNVYGVSKLAGEIFVKNTLEKHFIVRPSGIFGRAKKVGKANFIDRMIQLAKERKKLKIVDDQIFSPTYAKDLAEKISELIKTEKYGTYHITNSGYCSWYELAKTAFELVNIQTDLKPIKSKEFPAKAKRPKFSVLENKRLKMIGLKEMRHWESALKDYLKEIGEIQ